MTNTPFRFKQFTVHHDRTAMKVGTDGVLLGALAGSESPKNILEIGVGSGVISLMLAQRFQEAKITGVEIDHDAWLQATENAKNSKWLDRIAFHNIPFQEFGKSNLSKFDLIVSNPPYYSNHLKSNDHQKNLAMHSDALSFEELASGAFNHLGQKSEFWVILPPSQMGELEKIFATFGVRPFFKAKVKDKPSKNILRLIYGFSFNSGIIEEIDLSIKDKNGQYSNDYSELMKEFLIIF